jgi:EpsI family protein
MSGGRGIIALLLIAGTGALAQAARAPRAVRPALDTVPYRFASWTGRDGPALDADTQRALAADAYLTRTYTAEAHTPVDLYVAFYGQQRPGVSIHSPLHCLPGTGWEPLEMTTLDVAPEDGGGQVRRLVVRKNLQRAVVLYWYAIQGRTIGSELLSKAWLLRDSVFDRRSDAALVRLVVPVSGDGVEPAQQDGLAFARAILPYLRQLWS